ncbi:MAG: hypothetical protein ABIJ34_02415 [archaeon]
MREKIKKLMFTVILVLLMLIPFFLFINFLTHNYGILVYKRYDNWQQGYSPKNLFVYRLLKDIRFFQDKSSPPEVSHQLNLIYPRDVLAYDFRMPHPYAGFKTQPGINVVFPSLVGDQDIKVNSLGFRSDELGSKENGTIRIGILGGSSAFLGSSNDMAIVGILAKKIEAKGYKVEYINGAIVAAISNQELSVLVHDFIDLDVDIVIAFDGFNDILHQLQNSGFVGWPSFRWYDLYYPYVKPTQYRETTKKSLQNYIGNIKKMALISEAYKIGFIAVLQPMQNFSAGTCSIGMPVDEYTYFYCDAISEFDKMQKQKYAGANYVSFADLLQDRQDLFVDKEHFNDTGNEIAAMHLLKIIEKHSLLQDAMNKRAIG